MEHRKVYKETQLQISPFTNPSVADIRVLQFRTSTTGIMEAKLLAALSLLLVVGQCTGEQNLKHLPMHSFYYTGTLDECKVVHSQSYTSREEMVKLTSICTLWSVTVVAN